MLIVWLILLRETVIGFGFLASNYSIRKESPQSCLLVWQHCWWSRTFPVSSHGRQKLLTSADQATLEAEEYICNLKTAVTKSFSPSVVDFWWRKKPQISGTMWKKSSLWRTSWATFAQTWSSDKSLRCHWAAYSSCGNSRSHGGRTFDTGESLNFEQWEINIFASLFYFTEVRCKDKLWRAIKQFLDPLDDSF